ncbi:MAG: CPBP family intramembrane metalloprotease [Firmicutes bacterium]|jgi:membrane protease YdiL (CAAX protease family)|nr:CPBP family intramembrane metalloprotease [Bacillota bacterium]
MIKKNKFMLLSVVVYSLISGVGGLLAAVIYQLTGISYASYMLITLSIQCLLVIWSIYCYKKIGRQGKLFNKAVGNSIIWITPHYILLAIVLFDNMKSIATLDNTQILSLGIYFFTSIFIAVSEEVMFRGAILQYVLGRGKRKAVFYSAALFSVFHLSNILISGNILSTAFQLISTFFFGLFASAIVIKQKTLLPILIYHALWDFTMQITIFSESSSLLSTLGTSSSQLLNIIIAFILLGTLAKRKKKGELINE